MKVLDRFNEEIKPLDKISFLKILLKYKVVSNFGDINDWLKTTFGNIITK
jgi:hypothetical protein